MDSAQHETDMTVARPVKVAFLGPAGTYSHQAAHDAFGASAEYEEKRSIRDVFNALSPDIPYAVIPQENSIYGNVIETYDLMRLPEMGLTKFVAGEVILGVQHCLIVRAGTKIENIRRLLSHEQALGQCSGFISKHLPGACLEKAPSTAAAAKLLLSMNEDQARESAVIASKHCTVVFDGLEALHEGIQNENNNFTRFYVFSTQLNSKFPALPSTTKALVRVTMKLKLLHTDENTHAPISPVLAALNLRITRIDRRPSYDPLPFHDVYFIEAELRDRGAQGSQLAELERALLRVREGGGEGSIIGIW